MEIFAYNLKKRAQALGLSNAEVARRAGLSERRYGNYITARREPDLATLVRIAAVLATTTDDLLTEKEDAPGCARRLLMDRLGTAAALLTDDDLRVAIAQAEAVLALRSGER